MGPGMTDAELSHVEQEYGFEFADDHRAFLSVGLPLDETAPREPGVSYAHDFPWPDWRDGDPDVLREALAWPTQGILNEVGDGVWHESWGERPQDRTIDRTAPNWQPHATVAFWRDFVQT